MRIVSLNSLKGDENLGKPIYDDAGRTLLSEGVKLTPFYIEKLKNMGIQSVYISDELSKDVQVEETIAEKTRQMSKSAVKEMVDRYVKTGNVNNDGIVKSANSIIDDVLSKKEVMVNIADIRAKGDSLYSHSVNVCVLAVLIGIHMGYNMLRLKEVAVGALLHDVGKVKVVNDIKVSGEKLTPADQAKRLERMHPKAGYDLLSAQNSCSAISKIAVLMHHEKVDGSGYPLGLKASEIHEVARLVSICNTFDNMVTGSADEPAKPVYQVLEYLVGMSEHSFDGELVKKFAGTIAAFPTGSGVQLNTGEKCLVIRQNKALPVRPVLRVIYGRDGQKVAEPYEIDLNGELTAFVTGICEI